MDDDTGKSIQSLSKEIDELKYQLKNSQKLEAKYIDSVETMLRLQLNNNQLVALLDEAKKIIDRMPDYNFADIDEFESHCKKILP
jgi:hypothetical protein